LTREVTYAYADGGLCTSPRAGGVGVVLVENGEVAARMSANYPGEVTNQQMELEAAIQAIELAKTRWHDNCELVVRSDSAYLVNCFQQGWWVRWIANGWQNNEGKPVANADRWRRLLALCAGTHDRLQGRYGPNPWRRLRAPEDGDLVRRSQSHGVAVSFEKVKGHAGVEFNEEADRLATLGARMAGGAREVAVA
jgi:ribonuclease HI